MSSPDEFNDFSHLPSVDEVGGDAESGASALWKKHRRTETQARVVVKPVPAAEPQEDEAPAVKGEDWQALLEMEGDEPHFEVRRRAPEPAPRPQPQPVSRPPSQPIIEQPVPVQPVPLQPIPLQPAVREAPEPEPEPEALEPEASPEVPPEPRGEEDEEDDGLEKEAEDKESSSSETPPPPPPEIVKGVAEAAPRTAWQRRWDAFGGSALALSVGVHLLLIAGAAVYVVQRAMEPQIDFLPGGGTVQGEAASRDLEHKIQQKRSPWLKKSMPVQRIAALDKVSDIVLPDAVPDLLDLPSASNQLTSKLGAGMGLAGSGGGFGSGMGLGSRSGMVFQPFSMFGKEIKAKKLAVVLDVSASMAPHLPRVIAELDKVARGSVVVLFVGCGLEPPPPGGLDGEEIYRTSGPEFERFWRMGGGSLADARQFKFSSKDPIPNEAIFRLLSRRAQTYFIHEVAPGLVSYTWLALLSSEVRSADALYWFSDFQDRVDFRQLAIVRENLEIRKQKLYIHAYQRGSSFDLVRSQLVEPTNGDVIEEPE